jgi:hypothetical protein
MNRRTNIFLLLCLLSETKQNLKKVTFEWVGKERQKYGGEKEGEKDVCLSLPDCC